MSKLPANGRSKTEVCNTLDGRQFVPVVLDLNGVFAGGNTRRRPIEKLAAALVAEPAPPNLSESKPHAGFDDVPAMLSIGQAQRAAKRSNAR